MSSGKPSSVWPSLSVALRKTPTNSAKTWVWCITQSNSTKKWGSRTVCFSPTSTTRNKGSWERVNEGPPKWCDKQCALADIPKNSWSQYAASARLDGQAWLYMEAILRGKYGTAIKKGYLPGIVPTTQSPMIKILTCTPDVIEDAQESIPGRNQHCHAIQHGQHLQGVRPCKRDDHLGGPSRDHSRWNSVTSCSRNSKPVCSSKWQRTRLNSWSEKKRKPRCKSVGPCAMGTSRPSLVPCQKSRIWVFQNYFLLFLWYIIDLRLSVYVYTKWQKIIMEQC